MGWFDIGWCKIGCLVWDGFVGVSTETRDSITQTLGSARSAYHQTNWTHWYRVQNQSTKYKVQSAKYKVYALYITPPIKHTDT